MKPEEVEKNSALAKDSGRRSQRSARLGSLSFEPDVVLFACQPFSAMLLNEAAARAPGSRAVPRPLAALRA